MKSATYFSAIMLGEDMKDRKDIQSELKWDKVLYALRSWKSDLPGLGKNIALDELQWDGV
jgi:hypothetical protein